MIEVVKESIFDYNPGDYTWNKYLLLVDPINCNLNVMGKGLALEFKKRYPKEFKKEICLMGILILFINFAVMIRLLIVIVSFLFATSAASAQTVHLKQCISL